MHDIVALLREQPAQMHTGDEVDRIADRQRMTLDTLASRSLVEPSARIARELRMMPERKSPSVSPSTWVSPPANRSSGSMPRMRSGAAASPDATNSSNPTEGPTFVIVSAINR